MRSPKFTCFVAFSLATLVFAQFSRADEVIVPLGILKGTDYKPYFQVYTVPVQCGTVKADFTWGCYGVTQISESFAKKCDVKIVPAEELGTAFVGKGNIPIKLGGEEYNVQANIMKDSECQDSEKTGVIGVDIAKNRQWTLDPEKQTLTLRDNGSDPQTPPLAVLDLGNEGAGISVKVKVRNDTEDVGLMPSSSYVQAAPDLQAKWDLGGMEEYKTGLKMFGTVKIMTIHGKDQMELAPNITEQDVPIALMGDVKHPEETPDAQSGIGQCLLNRWVYTVDEDRRKFYILKRVGPDKAHPTTVPANPNDEQDTMEDFLKKNKK